VHAGEIDLAFANATHQFDAGESNSGAAEPLEPEHHVHSRFDVAVILLNQVTQVFRGSQFRSPCSDLSVFISRTARRDAA
jgi:hypothetical protein